MIFYKATYRFVFLIGFIFNFTFVYAYSKEQEIKLTLREVANDFLLQLGDSTSRILPISESNGRYEIQFDRTFSFLPGQLIFSVYTIFEKSKIKDNYLIEVEKCGTDEVAHSFEVNFNEENPYPACQERALPEDCYAFYFTPMDSLGNAIKEQKETPHEFEMDEEKENTAAKKTSNNIIYSSVFLVVIIGLYVFYRIKKYNIKNNLQQENARLNIDETNFISNSKTDIIQIGKFQFNTKTLCLIHGDDSVELSVKESDLLVLLYSNKNKTLEREFILNKVWGDEGDYVGRTLDVFVSKLRKKLEADSDLKIINVRGVGYRFVVG